MKKSFIRNNFWTVCLSFFGLIVGVFFFHSLTFLGYLLKIFLIVIMFGLFGFGIERIMEKQYFKSLFAIFIILLILVNWIFFINYKTRDKSCIDELDFRYYKNKFTGKCVEFISSCGKPKLYWAYEESEDCENLPSSISKIISLFEP